MFHFMFRMTIEMAHGSLKHVNRTSMTCYVQVSE